MAGIDEVLNNPAAIITKCFACSSTLEEPRFLPCMDIFCLNCLEKYGKGKVPGDKMNCPKCKIVFSIPLGGIKELPTDYFVNRLIERHRVLSSESGGEQPCELCLAVCENNTATTYCIECSQHLCGACCARHGTQRILAGHKVVTLKDKPSAEELRKMVPIYCQLHQTEEIKFHCYDCKMVACVICYVAKHNKHMCADVKEWEEEMRADLKTYSEKIVPHMLRNQREIEHLQESRAGIKNRFEARRKEIGKKFDELRSLLDSHKAELMAELDSLEYKGLDELETRKEEVERQLTIMKNFKIYCDEMEAKGTMCDLSRDANDLHTRGEELLNRQEEFMSAQPLQVDVTFLPSPTATNRDNNIIGTLVLGTPSTATTVDNLDISMIAIGLDLGSTISNEAYRISLEQPNSVSRLQDIPTEMSFDTRACTSGNNVFVTGTGRDTSKEAWKLDMSSGDWIRCADMVTSRKRHCSAIVDKHIYVLGGWGVFKALKSVDQYNMLTDKWSHAGNLIHSIQFAACVVYKNNIYVFGGDDGKGEPVAYVQVFNSSGTAHPRCKLMRKNMPYALDTLEAVLWETSAILLHRYMCLVYNFETKTWLERKQFKTDVGHFGFIINSESIFVAGGGTPASLEPENEVWNCTDEIRSVSVVNIIENRKPIVWNHHAKLPERACLHAYCVIMPASPNLQ